MCHEGYVLSKEWKILRTTENHGIFAKNALTFYQVHSTVVPSRYQGVDILLTNDWPKGITNLTKPLEEVDDLTVGSPLVSRLALLSRSAGEY